MGFLNLITGSHSGGKEQSPAHDKQPRLSPEYVPALLAELLEADNAIQNTQAANERLPITHPHLHAATIANPAIQGTFTHAEQITPQPVEPQEGHAGGYYEGKAPYGMIDTGQTDIAEAQARVAAAYASGQQIASQTTSPVSAQDAREASDV